MAEKMAKFLEPGYKVRYLKNGTDFTSIEYKTSSGFENNKNLDIL